MNHLFNMNTPHPSHQGLWITDLFQLESLDESERGEWKSWLKTQHSKNEDHGNWSHYFMGNRWGNSGNSVRLYFLGLQNHCRWWLQPWNQKTLAPWKKSYDQSEQHIKKQRHYFANKGPSSQGYGFSSGHVWMWELDYTESWVPKNWYFWTVVLEKTLESPLDCKEIQPVHPKGDQSWVFIWKDWCWSWNSNTSATWCKELTHLKRPWCWERLKTGGEGDIRGWDGWMASPTQWTWVWVNSGSWWWRRAAVHGVAKSWTQVSDWTELKCIIIWFNYRTIYKSLLWITKAEHIFLEHILSASQHTTLFTSIILFSQTLRWIIYDSHFTDEEIKIPERFYNLLKVT